MKKRYKLKEAPKTIVIIVCIYLLFIGYILLWSNRMEKIDRGEITVISESNMK